MKSRFASVLALAVSLFSVGCITIDAGGGNGQVDEPPQRPTGMRLLSVYLLDFPANKREQFPKLPWDSPGVRGVHNPDLFLTGNPFSFTPTVFKDVAPGRKVRFTERGGRIIPMEGSARIDLSDMDGAKHDPMGSVVLRPMNLYRNDQASSTRATVNGSNGMRVEVHVDWVY